MLPLTRSRNRARFFGTPFSPASLFAGGTVAGAWYDPSDLTTLFTTSAGTTQCAMPGQGSAVPVGLMLDKSQGLVLGSETVTNGGPFTATTGWTAGSGGTLSVSSQNLRITNGIADGGDAVFGASAPTAGKWYKVQFTIVARTSSAASRIIFGGNVLTGLNAGSYTYYLRATTTGAFTLSNGATGVIGEFADYNNISVRELPGNHAIAFNDTTARPELSARVNLLTWSEVFNATASGSAWINAGVTVTDGVLAPNGTNTADTITGTTGAYPHVRQAITFPAAGTYKASCYFQKTSGATRFPALEVYFAPGNALVVLNTDTGVAANAQGTPTNISVSDAGGYWLVSFDVAVNITSATFYIYPASSSNGTSVAPNLTGSCVAWGADLRPANIGANVPAYQRIADANTYETSGFPLYLRFDGIDDSMYTPANLNLSGTDKVSVFAGARKLSDAAAASLVEFSANTSLNTGTFATYAPGSAAANYVWRSYGTATADVTATTFSAPITNVLTGIGNIGGDISQLRANGSVAGTNTGDQGAGNFGTYPLYIGSRGNSSLWLNGHLYSLVVAGSAVSAGNISATEQWVAGKTGIQI